ncbi:MAG: hypothetical protein P1P90_02350 [Patescibacteria group bacterium]|nr:hypothetical protein [Patescibacteria group bacterium]
MVVLNWIKETLDSGHKLVLRPFTGSFGIQSKQKQRIISEQRALADHFQKCSVQFIDKLEQLTEKIASLENGNQQTANYIKQRQQALFFACLRMETALKTNAELRRERKEWERRLPSPTPIDAYHPLVRLEVIDSELRIREENLISKSDSEQVHDNAPSTPTYLEINPANEPVAVKDTVTASISHGFCTSDELKPLSEELIIKRAEGLLIEISSQHNNMGNSDEYLEKTQELRDIHNTLRQLQRKNRHQSYRLRLRERMSQLFS